MFNQLLLINLIFIFSCSSNEVISQQLKGKWLGNIYDYELKNHSAIEFQQHKVYLYGLDLVTIVDSIKRKGNYLITTEEYKGKIRPINRQVTCIENLPLNQDKGKCDMFYKISKTLISCLSATLEQITNKSTPLYGGVDKNGELFISKTIDQENEGASEEIEKLNLFLIDETYFLKAADYDEDSILLPILEIRDNYILAINNYDNLEMKFYIR